MERARQEVVHHMTRMKSEKESLEREVRSVFVKTYLEFLFVIPLNHCIKSEIYTVRNEFEFTMIINCTFIVDVMFI